MAKKKMTETRFFKEISRLERVACLLERISNFDKTIPESLKQELLKQTLSILIKNKR